MWATLASETPAERRDPDGETARCDEPLDLLVGAAPLGDGRLGGGDRAGGDRRLHAAVTHGGGNVAAWAPPADVALREQRVRGARDLPVVHRQHDRNPPAGELVDDGQGELVIDVVQMRDVGAMGVQ